MAGNQQQPQVQTNIPAVHTITERTAGKEVKSDTFVATLYSVGIRDQFISLQKLLATIDDSKNFIQEFSDGTMFQDLLKSFTAKEDSIFSNSMLFGNTEPRYKENYIMETRENLRRTATVINDIEDALDILTEMYSKVNSILSNTQSTYFSSIKRSEKLVTWAVRKGIRLNKDIDAYPSLMIGSKNYITPTDLLGLLDLFDTIRMELETLRTLPAYYQTGTDTSKQNLQTPVRTVRSNKHQSIEALAQAELGDAGKVDMILEFNRLEYADVSGDTWDGAEIHIPSIAPHEQSIENNMVLDAHTGAQAFGKDIDNEVITDQGDLKVLPYSETFFQSVQNIIRTPYGSIVDSPEWGCRAIAFIGGNMGDIATGIASIEIARAIQSDPRVEAVTDVNAKIEGDEYRVQYKVHAINQVTEDQLITNLETT